ncbi:hypothetical protein [Halodesulfovibrio aestuarii]|uniref:hypothetical protein n=1 Tax=Halodesulfovibrio aestuarii TaxID=126333 RepID=UPI0003FDBC7C
MKKLLRICIVFLCVVSCACTATSEEMASIQTKVTPEMIKVKYLVTLQTNVAYCASHVNDIELFSNYNYDSGTVSTGYNATAYLENGENEISLHFISHKMPNDMMHEKGARCDVQVTAATPTKEAIATSITASADSSGAPTSSLSKKYFYQNQPVPVEEGYLNPDSPIYKMSRKVVCKGLPEWAWTKATPLTNSRKTYQMLQDAYIKLGLIFAKNDLTAFKKAIWLSMEERAMADGLTPEEFFATTEMEEDFSEKMTGVQVTDWSEYKLRLYKGGRIASLEDFAGLTPVSYKDSDGKEYTFKCFFSLINGQLVISR